MSRFNFTIVLGDDLSPFAPSKHHDLTGVGSVVNLLGTALANQQSEINIDKVNAVNDKMFNQQLAAQSAWNKIARDENRYLVDQAYERQLKISDPAFIKKRLLDAGINPAFAMDNGSFSSSQVQAGSVPSQGQVPTPHSAIAPDPTILGNGFSNAVNSFLAEQRQEADISYIKTKEANETLETLGKLEKFTYENKHLEQLSNQIRQQILWNQDTWEQRRQSISYANQVMAADAVYKNTQSDLNKQAVQLNIDQNNRAWMELSQFISESKSRISLNGHLGQMYDSQSNLNYSQQDVNVEIWKDKKFYNSKIEEIYTNNKGQADAILRKLNYETSVQGWKDFVRMFQGFIPFGGMYQ